MGLFSRLKKSRQQRQFAVLESTQSKFCEAIFKMGVVENALNVGDQICVDDFENCYGRRLNLSSMLERGPVVLKFILGTWSPSCLQDLEDTHEAWEDFTQLGATTVVVSTERATRLSQFANETQPNYHLVADSSLSLTKEFGLLIRFSEELAQAYQDSQGVRLSKYYGSSTPDLAMPATFVIDRSGFIVYASFSEDLQARPEIDEVLQALANIAVDQKRYLLVCKEEETRSRSFISNLKKVFTERAPELLISPSSSPKKVPKSRSLINLSVQEADEEPFRYCLQQDEFVESFKGYLQRSYCVENLLFYLEATHFRLSFETLSEDARRQAAARIIKTYIHESTDLQINVDDDTKATIEGRFQRGLITEDLFADAARAVFRLMEHDSFPKWQRTRDYREVWKNLGSPAALRPTPSFV